MQRLSDIAYSLLKSAPYDPETMACRGLKRYMNDILPAADWSSDDMRPAFSNILRRIDKTFSKIYKKASIRRNTDWDAASDLLKGIHETLLRRPYIAHFQYLKTLLTTCQVSLLDKRPFLGKCVIYSFFSGLDRRRHRTNRSHIQRVSSSDVQNSSTTILLHGFETDRSSRYFSGRWVFSGKRLRQHHVCQCGQS